MPSDRSIPAARSISQQRGRGFQLLLSSMHLERWVEISLTRFIAASGRTSPSQATQFFFQTPDQLFPARSADMRLTGLVSPTTPRRTPLAMALPAFIRARRLVRLPTMARPSMDLQERSLI